MSRPTDYNPLPPEEDIEKHFYDNSLPRSTARVNNKWIVVSVVSWIITAFLIGVQFRPKPLAITHSYEGGWDTDFVSVRDAIGIEQKTFTGAPAIKDDGTVFVEHYDPINYVAEPSPEVDLAWENLVGGRYFLVTEDEAKATWGSEYESYWSYDRGGYVAGLDIFHTLHCLDQIRRRLRPDYYPAGHGPPAKQHLHNGHCIEQLRQYLMCAGDVTVLGTRYYEGLGRNYVLSDVPHTCRNFDRIRKWTWDRFNGSTAVPRVEKPRPNGIKVADSKEGHTEHEVFTID